MFFFALNLIFQHFSYSVHTQTYHACVIFIALNRSFLDSNTQQNVNTKGCLYWYFNNHLGKINVLKASPLIFT